MQAQQPYLQGRFLAAVLEQHLYSAPACGITSGERMQRCKAEVNADDVHRAVEKRLLQLDPFITESLQKGVLSLEDVLVLLPEHQTIKSYKQVLVKHMEATSQAVCTSAP